MLLCLLLVVGARFAKQSCHQFEAGNDQDRRHHDGSQHGNDGEQSLQQFRQRDVLPHRQPPQTCCGNSDACQCGGSFFSDIE